MAARWPGPVAATVELHIEQGPVLDRSGPTIGVVTAIAAQQRGTIVITGLNGLQHKTVHISGALLTLFEKRIHGALFGRWT